MRRSESWGSAEEPLRFTSRSLTGVSADLANPCGRFRETYAHGPEVP